MSTPPTIRTISASSSGLSAKPTLLLMTAVRKVGVPGSYAWRITFFSPSIGDGPLNKTATTDASGATPVFLPAATDAAPVPWP
jgi:hypothetical protein